MSQKFANLKKNFITGLVILLPLILTLAIIGFLINFLTKPFVGLVSSTLNHFSFAQKGLFFLSREQLVLYTSKVLVLLALLGFTLILGVFTRIFFMKSLLSLGDALLHKIPVVNTVYKTTQDIIKTLFVSDKNSFKQVVMVPFPRDGMYMLGLIVRESPKVCSDSVDEPLVSVLIPTTPNPTTGFLVMVRKSDLRPVDIKPEDAIKYIVSCGVIIPSCEKR